MATSKIQPEAPAIRIIDYGYHVTEDFDAREQLTISAANLEVQPVEGYTPLMINSFSCSSDKVDIMWVNVTTSGAVMRLVTANQTGFTSDFDVYVSFAWVRNDLIGSI